MAYQNRHHHGNASAGRVTVGVVCLAVLAANGLIFWKVASPEPPILWLKILTLITPPWLLAGGWYATRRAAWGRGMMLIVLYVGTAALFMAAVMTLVSENAPLRGRLGLILAAAAIYLIAGLVVTHSKDIRRLTSRAYD